MRTIFAILALLVWAVPSHSVAAEDGWIPIFNGKNLQGWTVKIAGRKLNDNYRKTFRVHDGVLQVCYDGYKMFDDHFGHLFYKQKLSHYRLRLDYRFIGQQTKGAPAWALRNNGIMLHCQSPQSMSKAQFFPVSIEAQLLGGDGQTERSTGNVCTPGTHVVINGQLITQHCIESISKTYAGDQWVTAEVEVNGHGSIVHYINGERVLQYEQPQLDPTDPDAQKLIRNGVLRLEEGYIALQAESHPVEFRNILLKLIQ